MPGEGFHERAHRPRTWRYPFATSNAFWRWIDQCEATAIDSIWLSERLVSKVPNLEPMVALAAIGGRTKRLKFGMNAVVLPLRDPLVLAKECATIDYLSNGRLLPAFGVGNDIAPEFKATGRKTTDRGARADEMIELLSRLWSEDEVTFDGRYYHYDRASISPRPVQKELPMWIGGSSPAAVRRTARLGTGWLGGGAQTPAQVSHVITSIKAALGEAGRTIDEDHYGCGVAFRFGGWDEPAVQRAAEAAIARTPGLDPRRVFAVGGAREIIDVLRPYREAGVSKFVLRPMAADEDDILAQSRLLAEEVIPEVHAWS